MTHDLKTHQFHTLIIGAGGAGLRAAVAAVASGKSVAVISKVPPTRSHTVAAQGGINAALGNRTPDDWRWHMFDTIKGSDYLADEDAVAVMCEAAPAAIVELEQMGMPFTRDDNGKIYQRAYGGQRTDFGKGELAYRACAVADRTGHSLLHTLYAHAVKHHVMFFEEFLVLDLIMHEGECHGVLAWELETGDLHVFRAHTTILATGGFGQIYASTTASSICTGDGGAMCLRAGIPLKDMEFIQFHPTGLYGSGLLITEGARGEGAYLLNGLGERFMQRYQPETMELSSRDVISRAMVQEMISGRGAGSKKDHLLLALDHLPRDVIETKLPSIREIAKTFGGIDVFKQPVPVLPTVHYTMGGIPTDTSCRVVDSESWIVNREKNITTNHEPRTTIHGLMAIGEAACASVHGANRLGCNSLLELVVFGKIAGVNAALCNDVGYKTLPSDCVSELVARFEKKRAAKGVMRPRQIKHDIKQAMQRYVNIFRSGGLLEQAQRRLQIIVDQWDDGLLVADNSRMWNTDLIEAIEAENLLALARATVASALARTESRGAQYREDFPAKDDENWRVHTLCDGVEVAKSAIRKPA